MAEVMTFDEVRIKTLPEIVADALIEVSEHVTFADDTFKPKSSLKDVAAMVLDSFDFAGLDERYDYWASNFIIVGLID
jgi:hypothetical protein